MKAQKYRILRRVLVCKTWSKCLEENLHILEFHHQAGQTTETKTELLSKYKHENKYLLCYWTLTKSVLTLLCFYIINIQSVRDTIQITQYETDNCAIILFGALLLFYWYSCYVLFTLSADTKVVLCFVLWNVSFIICVFSNKLLIVSKIDQNIPLYFITFFLCNNFRQAITAYSIMNLLF